MVSDEMRSSTQEATCTGAAFKDLRSTQKEETPFGVSSHLVLKGLSYLLLVDEVVVNFVQFYTLVVHVFQLVLCEFQTDV
jgi:hypothetical protein